MSSKGTSILTHCCSIPRLLLYPKSTHSLSEVEVESDSFMNAVIWMCTHLGH